MRWLVIVKDCQYCGIVESHKHGLLPSDDLDEFKLGCVVVTDLTQYDKQDILRAAGEGLTEFTVKS